MNAHIDTAPVLEAFTHGGECPLCDLRWSTEESYLDSFLGGSVMEPAARVIVNEKGFCADHFRMLYDRGNRLGLALMAHSHMIEAIKRCEARVKSQRERPRPIFGLGSKRSDSIRPDQTCALCDRLDATMDRYAETTIYLWEHEAAFRERFNKSLGLCMPHGNKLMALANAKGKGAFADALAELQLANLRRVEKELEWFTLKFDYRNQDKPWGNSKDALIRAALKLSGARCGD